MGIITGYICLLCLILLLFKFVARRLHLQKFYTFLQKTHKYTAIAFMLLTALHFLLVQHVIKTRMPAVTVSGVAMLVAGVCLSLLYIFIKNRKTEIHFHRAFSAALLILLVVHLVTYFADFASYLRRIDSIAFESVDLTTIDDGMYTGDYDAGYIRASVAVTVHDHTITDIQLLAHDNERGQAAESILSSMIERQSIEVDAISGATNSSRVIMKACENALLNAKEAN